MQPTFVRPATLADARHVAANLRDADRQEVLAAVGLDPRIALPAYVQEGREVYAAGVDFQRDIGELLFGVDPIPYVDSAAVVWMLSTDVIYDHPVEFVKRSGEILGGLHDRFELLTNFIDARNTRHIHWLQRMGFHIIRRIEQFGAGSLPFYEFASFRPQCA